MTETARLVLAVDSSSARKATSVLDDLTKAGKRSESAIGDLRGKMAGLAIGAGVLAGIKAIISATIEAEKAQAQLHAVLKSTKGVAGLTADEINRMADELSVLTGVDDEAITGAQSLLLTFTKIGREAFPRATEAALDMSVAMGTDLQSAVMQVGKALNSPTEGLTALSRAGVQFTDAQKKLIEKLVETGDSAEAQRIILLELETQFGGSAEAARNTFGGALAALKVDVGNLLEGDGDGLHAAKDAVDDLGKTMRSESVKAGFAAMVAGLTNVTTFALEAIGAVAGLSNAISQAMTANNEKTYDGLLARQFELEDKLGKMKKRGASSEGLFGLGTTREEVEAELVQIRTRMAELRREKTGRPVGPLVMDEMIIKAPSPGKAKSGGRAKRDTGASDAAREAREAAAANEDFRRTLEDLRAEMGGPLAQVQLEYTRREDELIRLAKAGKVSNEDLATSLDLLEAQRQKEIKAIEEQKTPTQQMISDKEFELSLLQMTNIERQTAIDLRYLEGKATDEQAAKIRTLNEAYEHEQQAISVMDDFRSSVEDTFASILDGSKSAKEAFTDLADSIIAQIARMIAQQWVSQMFGQMGTSGGGAAGGGIMSFLGSFLPGFASGTNYAPGGAAIVGEHGPEIVNLPRGSQVVPNHRLERNRGAPVVNINMREGTAKETALQTASKVSMALRMHARSA